MGISFSGCLLCVDWGRWCGGGWDEKRADGLSALGLIGCFGFAETGTLVLAPQLRFAVQAVLVLHQS